MVEIKRKPKPQILFEENRDKFNKLVSEGKCPELASQNLSDLDLSGFDLSCADLRNCYMRGTNLAGVDLHNAQLDGASIKKANISGCFFPADLPPEEIRLSLETGSRLRHPIVTIKRVLLNE